MKRFFVISLLFLPCCLLRGQQMHDGAWEDLTLSGASWHSSANAAGLLSDTLPDFNTLEASYLHQSGDYRLLQDGTSNGAFSFDTKGLRKIGKVQLWGHFRYDNSSERGSSFNTMLSDPFDERFLYHAADSVPGLWKKQSYLMQFKAATALSDKLGAGIHLKYNDRIAASQIDPRAESYHYSVTVSQALVWKTGIGTFGLDGTYANTFERSTPSISNTQEIQKVYLMRGLGNWVGGQIGGSGLSTMYYRCNSWGGALQYALDRSSKFFSEISYLADRTVITESATQPKPHGSTLRQTLQLNADLQWGHDIRHIAGIDVKGIQTVGTEPTVLWNKESGRWETAMNSDQVKMLTLSATASWEAFVMDADSYSWHFEARAGWEQKKDTYALPYSCFEYGNVLASAGAGRHWTIGKSSLEASLNVGYVKNLFSAYSYSGHRSGTLPVEQLYPHNLSILGSDRLNAGAALEYAFPIAGGVNLAFGADAGIIYAFPRYTAFATGALKLYF